MKRGYFPFISTTYTQRVAPNWKHHWFGQSRWSNTYYPAVSEFWQRLYSPNQNLPESSFSLFPSFFFLLFKAILEFYLGPCPHFPHWSPFWLTCWMFTLYKGCSLCGWASCSGFSFLVFLPQVWTVSLDLGLFAQLFIVFPSEPLVTQTPG